MYLSFYTANKDYDEVFLQNYIDINVVPEIKRISGVGDANLFGGKTYSMRIWLKPEKLANYGLDPSDVIDAINAQSKEAAAGQIGSNSGSSFEYIMLELGRIKAILP